MRSRDDFPAPLRPRIVRPSPDATEKLTPAKTSRPPRRQARSEAESRINNVLRKAREPSRPRAEHATQPFPACYRPILADLAQVLKRPYKPKRGQQRVADAFRVRPPTLLLAPV